MKTHSEKLHALLHEVLPSAGEHCGLTSAGVLHLLHDERRRLHRFRRNIALLVVLTMLLSAVLWRHSTPATAPVASTKSQSAPLVIRHVNDEQLFALLKDTPAALMKFPDGTSRLLVLDQ